MAGFPRFLEESVLLKLSFMKNKLALKILNPFSLNIKLINLKFRDRIIERAFTVEYLSKTVSLMLLYISIGLLIYLAFGFFYPSRQEIIIRFYIVAPVLFFITLGISFKLIKKNIYPAITIFPLLLGGSYIIAMSNTENGLLNHSIYFSGLILIVFAINAFLRLKLGYMIFINISIFIFYLVYHYFVPNPILLNSAYFQISQWELLSAIAIGWLASYNFEYLYRNDFYHRKIIEDQANKLQESNEIMELKIIERTHELEQERNRSLKAILEGQQIERQRIAQDLHDSLNIQLIGLKRKLEAKTDQKNEEILGEIDSIIAHVREISHDLLPYSLKHFGLVKAIDDLCFSLEKQNEFKVNFSKIDINEDSRWDIVIETELFRIIQELVTNIIKYAHAHNVMIEFIADENMLYLTVEDDGIGFDLTDTTRHRFGLNNIEARLSILEGTVSFDSQTGRGTIVMINVPTT
jgi:signal transduction histidine kinase